MLLREVYVAKVVLINAYAVDKCVLRLPVVKITGKYVTCSDYGMHVKFLAADCFATLEEAEVECEGRASELVAQLVRCVEELKKPARLIDHVPAEEE